MVTRAARHGFAGGRGVGVAVGVATAVVVAGDELESGVPTAVAVASLEPDPVSAVSVVGELVAGVPTNDEQPARTTKATTTVVRQSIAVADTRRQCTKKVSPAAPQRRRHWM
jgi:hypothetical protein